MKKTILIWAVLVVMAFPVWAMQMAVTWDPNTDYDLAGYKVYWGLASGVYGDPVDVGNNTECSIKELDDSTTYYVAITAYDIWGNESGKSEEVHITSPDIYPSRVTGLTYSSDSDGVKTVRWNASSGAVGYKIYMGTASGSIVDPPIDVGNSTSYTVTLGMGTYYSRVVAYDRSHGRTDADPSAEIVIVVKDTTAPAVPSKPRLSWWDSVVNMLKRIFGNRV